MKTKALPNETSNQKRFFLLMIAPLLIGLMISLTNFAHADWNKNEDSIKNPIKQGWTQIQTHRAASENPTTNTKL